MAINTDWDQVGREITFERGKVFQGIISEVYEVNSRNGWFDKERSFGDDIALLHSEVSEALEGYRTGDMVNVLEEFADIVIRLADTLKRRDISGHDLAEAIDKKMERNRQRGYRHGGKAL